jgi:GntP family gluconate:H+ symporter
MILILLLVASVALIIVLSTKLKVHAFLSLLIAALFFGLLSGMPFDTIVQSINAGFGETLGKIGMVIVLGVIIGEFLEKSGGAYKMAAAVVSVIGRKSVAAAMAFIGYIVSIPVFADSAFIILTPLNKSLTRAAGLSFTTTSLALVLGLVTTHTMAPPTPGPIAAAGALDANLGLVLLIGLPVAFGAMLVCLFYAIRVGRTMPALADTTTDSVPVAAKDTPNLALSALPIFAPIFLIVVSAMIDYYGGAFAASPLGQFLKFIGNPVIALTVGFFLALLLPKKLKKDDLSDQGWVGKALKDAAIIILITGAGGSFGKVLQNSGIADSLSDMLSQWKLGLWLPFILAAAIKTAQGSSTVAIITTASIVAPLMVPLGFGGEIERAIVVLAIGAGGAVVSHVNDSMFWIFTQITGIDVRTGLKKYTPGTFVLGMTAILLLNLIYYFL